MEWRMAEAKNRFSELMNRALHEGPQRVRRRDDAVVMLAEREYERLTGTRPDFKEFLMSGETFDGLDLRTTKALAAIFPCEAAPRYLRGVGDPFEQRLAGRENFIDAFPAETLLLSVITIGEVCRGLPSCRTAKETLAERLVESAVQPV